MTDSLTADELTAKLNQKHAEASEAGRKLAQRRAEKRREAESSRQEVDNEEDITEDDEVSEDTVATGTDEDGEAPVGDDSQEGGESDEGSEAEHADPVNLADHFAEDWEEARNEYTIPYRENGQDKVATLKEAQEALSKAGDYGTRNAAFKTERQTWETEKAQVEQQLSGTVQHLAQLRQNLHQVFAGSPPNRAMLDANSEYYNPDQYHFQLAVFQENLGKLQTFEQQLHQHRQQLQQAEQQQMAAVKEQEMAKLREHWPTVDADWAVTKRKAVEAFGQLGVTEDQLEALPTAAARYILNEAVKAHDTAQRVKVTKKAMKKLPKLKTGRPGAMRAPGEAQHRAKEEAKARARKSGKLDDVVRALDIAQQAHRQTR